jgi:hypothetical protein
MIEQNEIAMALKPVADAFAKLGVSYFVGGSVASSAYGVARSTLDVDMVSHLKREHVCGLISALKDLYYISEELIVGAIQRSSSFNLIHLGTGLKVDVFITKNRPYDQVATSRAREDSLSDEDGAPRFYLASPEDVILAKLEWFKSGGETSTRQWNDILGVFRVQNTHLDRTYLRHWAVQLGISELLEKAIAAI